MLSTRSPCFHAKNVIKKIQTNPTLRKRLKTGSCSGRSLPMSLRTQICIGLFVSMLFLSLPGFAQETTGGIQGTVKDPPGAVIPGAAVEVTSAALIGKKIVTTNARCYHQYERLPPRI